MDAVLRYVSLKRDELARLPLFRLLAGEGERGSEALDWVPSFVAVVARSCELFRPDASPDEEGGADREGCCAARPAQGSLGVLDQPGGGGEADDLAEPWLPPRSADLSVTRRIAPHLGLLMLQADPEHRFVVAAAIEAVASTFLEACGEPAPPRASLAGWVPPEGGRRPASEDELARMHGLVDQVFAVFAEWTDELSRLARAEREE